MTAVVAKFWPALELKHVTLLIRTSQRRTIRYTKQSFPLETSPDRSRGCTSSWGHHRPEDISFHPEQGETNSINVPPMFMEFVMPPGYLTLQTLQQILTWVQTVTIVQHRIHLTENAKLRRPSMQNEFCNEGGSKKIHFEMPRQWNHLSNLWQFVGES